MARINKTSRSRISLLLIGISLLAMVFPPATNSFQSSPNGDTRRASNYLLASPGTPNATIAVLPNATIDLSRTIQQFTIELSLNNTPDVPSINGVQVELQYNATILNAVSLDYSSNVFTGYPTDILANCLDSHGICGRDDGPGITSFAETILGTATPDGTEGNIFFLTFRVVDLSKPRFTQIAIRQGAISYGSTPYAVTLLSGYYTSQNCGGKPCKPGVAKFTWSPQPLKQGQLAIFYANASLPSTNAVITDYNWFFDDSQAIIRNRDTGTNSTATWVFELAEVYLVTLTVTDSNGIQSITTNSVKVVNADVDMGIASISATPGPFGLHAGVVFTITAVLKNYGGVKENTTITVTLAAGNKLLNSTSVVNMKPSSTVTLKATWDSTGYAPNVYRIDASTPLVANESATDKNPNERSFWVQIVPIQPGGSLSLLSTAGLSVLVIGAGGAGVSFIRKRSRKEDDSL